MLDAEKLLFIMKSKGIKSMKELSLKSGVPYSTLNYMINGHDMYLGTLANIAKCLKEPIESFINMAHNYIVFYEQFGEVQYKNIKANNLYEVTARYMM